MPTPFEVCEAKCRVAEVRMCSFGKPNHIDPSVVFEGCPACHNVSLAGTSIEDIEADMRSFVDKARSINIAR